MGKWKIHARTIDLIMLCLSAPFWSDCLLTLGANFTVYMRLNCEICSHLIVVNIVS